MMRFSESYRWLTVVWMVFFVSLILMVFIAQQPETLFLGVLLCAIYAALSIEWAIIQASTIWAVFIFVALCMPSIVTLNHGVSSVFYLFSSISVFFAAKQFFEHSLEELLTCFRVVFALAVIGISYALIEYWGRPEPLGEIIPGSSTNGIPSYLIVLQVTLSIATFLAKGRLPLISPALTLMVAYFGLGRGSLVIATLILASSILGNFILGRLSVLQRVLILIFVLAGVVATTLNWSIFLEILVDGTKLQEGLHDPYRMEILYQYIGQINAWSLITGAEYAYTVIETQYDGNPHISLIRTHAYFGLFVLLAVILSPLLIFTSNKPWGDKIVVFLFIEFVFLRALSEPILFPTLLDFFYFGCFFMFFKSSQLEVLSHQTSSRLNST